MGAPRDGSQQQTQLSNALNKSRAQQYNFMCFNSIRASKSLKPLTLSYTHSMCFIHFQAFIEVVNAPEEISLFRTFENIIGKSNHPRAKFEGTITGTP
jgi:hypothetical protein